MTQQPIYVPILKGKEGEFAALETLRVDVRSSLMPLIEIPAVPYDHKNRRPSKNIDEHVLGIPDKLSKSGIVDRMYLHLAWFDEKGRTHELDKESESVLKKCDAVGITVVPVISRTSSDVFLNAVADYSARHRVGTCLRLRLEDFGEDIDLDADTDRLINRIGATDATSIDLIIDLEDLGTEPNRGLHVTRSIFTILPRKQENDWRRMVLAASSFPVDLSEVEANNVELLPRHEWNLWKALQRKPNGLPRRDLIYGDYAISNPVVKELDPTKMRMSANIRYATEDSWLIMKGRNVREYGFSQYFELCEALVDRPEYSGREFSWADKYIEDCALAMQGPGNATTWRKVGVNHHLTLVAKQLANVSLGS